MKKELTQELNELSLTCFGNRYAWRKLTRKGLVTARKCVNPNGPSAPAFVARRIPLTPKGAEHYMLETLRMREEVKKQESEDV